MSNTIEQQADEHEALQSIYEGDSAFNEISPTVYQYKYGIDDDDKSFLVEIQWNDNYPNEKPDINMDIFYNRNLSSNFKEKIRCILLEEAEHWIGSAMTYTLFEFLKDYLNSNSFGDVDNCRSSTELVRDDLTALQISDDSTTIRKEDTKKEHLTKAQKRRQWDNVGINGDKPRGWNWVDIIKHLSQTNHKENSSNVGGTTKNE